MECQACGVANDDDAKFCKECATVLDTNGDEVRALRRKVRSLEKRLASVEATLQSVGEATAAADVAALQRQIDASPFLRRDGFLARAFRLWAHVIAAQAIVAGVLFLVAAAFGWIK